MQRSLESRYRATREPRRTVQEPSEDAQNNVKERNPTLDDIEIDELKVARVGVTGCSRPFADATRQGR